MCDMKNTRLKSLRLMPANECVASKVLIDM